MCNTCKKVLKSPSSTTTTLVRHLKIHTKKYSEYQACNEEKKIKKEASKRKIEDTTQKQNKIQDSFNSKSYLSQNSARAKLITQNISEMIALD